MTEEKFNSCVLEKEVELCIEWLSMQDKLKHPNKRFHSYRVKHIVENYYKEYISEASLVEAVKRVRFPYKDCDPYSVKKEKDGTRTRRSWSIYLCVASKTVNKSIKHYLNNPYKGKFNHATS